MKGLGKPPAGTRCADCNFHGRNSEAVAYLNLAPLCRACYRMAQPHLGRVVPPKQRRGRAMMPAAEPCPGCMRAMPFCACNCPRCRRPKHAGRPCEAGAKGIRGAGNAGAALAKRVAEQMRQRRVQLALSTLCQAVEVYLDYSDHANRMAMKAEWEAARVELAETCKIAMT